MRWLFSLLIVAASSLSAREYDVAVVGTSPICMIEALYYAALGEQVVILEDGEGIGGAWKTITACGVEGVDLGCHQLGKDPEIKAFLEERIGCQFLCLSHPTDLVEEEHRDCPLGYYFTKGCSELITALLERVHSYPNIDLILKKLERVSCDPQKGVVHLEVDGIEWEVGRLVCSAASHFELVTTSSKSFSPTVNHFYHLYMLIDDPSPPRFTYLDGGVSGMQRSMNLTHFAQTLEKNRQLIVIQVHNKSLLEEGERFLTFFKDSGYLDPQATILKTESVIYQQSYGEIRSFCDDSPRLLEFIDTGRFWGMSQYLPRWQMVIPPL